MLRIRPFTPTDTESVVTLWRRCDLVKPWNNPYRDITRKLAVGADLFLVAEADGALVGSIMGGYEGHRGWINYLAVAPTAQRRGIGAELMSHVEKKLRARGCPKINLQIRRGNEDVVAFYQAIGYREDAVISFGKRLIPDNKPE